MSHNSNNFVSNSEYAVKKFSWYSLGLTKICTQRFFSPFAVCSKLIWETPEILSVFVHPRPMADGYSFRSARVFVFVWKTVKQRRFTKTYTSPWANASVSIGLVLILLVSKRFDLWAGHASVVTYAATKIFLRTSAANSFDLFFHRLLFRLQLLHSLPCFLGSTLGCLNALCT